MHASTARADWRNLKQNAMRTGLVLHGPAQWQIRHWDVLRWHRFVSKFLCVKDDEKPEIRGLRDMFVFSDWRGLGWTSTRGWLRL